MSGTHRLILALGLLLAAGLAAGIWIWSSRRAAPVPFCSAASDPASYGSEWFYRLHQAPEGWLLRDDDLVMESRVGGEALSDLTALNEVLKRAGVTLVIAAQPPRGVALGASSVAGYDPAAARAAYRALVAQLKQRGLHVADLSATVTETPHYFFRRDHHWTPVGARASAEAVAEVINTLVDPGLQPYPTRTRRAGRERQLGSFGEAIERICGTAPPSEGFWRFRTVATSANNNTLFANTTPPLTLVGTSNSARDDLNFAGFLEQATGLGLNASAVGGGPQAALDAYLRSETFQQRKPTVIIWEFATLFDLPQDPIFYRQLIASIAGGCSTDTSVAHMAVPASASLTLFDAPAAGATRLMLELSDLSQTQVSLDLSYHGGRKESVTLKRPTRERNDGRYFLRAT